MDNYEVLEHLNSGSFGKVCKIRRKSDNKILVWKELSYANMNDKEKQQLVAEVNILRELRHPSIVRYYDRILDKQNQKIWIVQEYCDGGDLAQLIKKCKKEKDYMPEDLIWKFFMQIILALHEIHKRKEGKILHRDIKPANIFIDSQMNAKIGDFGLSKILTDESGFAYTTVGTPYYMSPEQITDKKYNEKSDIWSCGCLLYEMASLSRPFEASNHLSLALKIKSGKFDRIPSHYSNELQRVIQWILTRDFNERPSVEELLNIPEISMRLRDKRVKETLSVIKKKEDEIKKKMQELEELEIALKNRETELAYREAKLNDQEKLYQETVETKPRQYSSKNLMNIINKDKEETYDKDMPKLKLTGQRFYTQNDLSSDRGYGTNDKNFNTTMDGMYGIPKVSRQVSKTEDSTVGETYLNIEINNILKNMDRIVAQTMGAGFNNDDSATNISEGGYASGKELSRKNSSKVL